MLSSQRPELSNYIAKARALFLARVGCKHEIKGLAMQSITNIHGAGQGYRRHLQPCTGMQERQNVRKPQDLQNRGFHLAENGIQTRHSIYM